jgi:hypothetical protein
MRKSEKAQIKNEKPATRQLEKTHAWLEQKDTAGC